MFIDCLRLRWQILGVISKIATDGYRLGPSPVWWHNRQLVSKLLSPGSLLFSLDPTWTTGLCSHFVSTGLMFRCYMTPAPQCLLSILGPVEAPFPWPYPPVRQRHRTHKLLTGCSSRFRHICLKPRISQFKDEFSKETIALIVLLMLWGECGG